MTKENLVEKEKKNKKTRTAGNAQGEGTSQ